MHKETEHITKALSLAVSENTFIQLSMMNKRDPKSDLKSATCNLIQIKKGQRLNIVYRHQTKDITKNYGLDEGKEMISKLIQDQFTQAILYTTRADIQLSFNKSNTGKIKTKAPSRENTQQLSHDRIKNRLISISNNIYLRELGVLSTSGKINNAKQDKYKQINKYVEIIDGILKPLADQKELHIVDMGSGKGYLTFALYDYLLNKTKIKPTITGIELRKDLIDTCNEIAKKCQFDRLNFLHQKIEDVQLDQLDVLIALHACDTATDDAIAQGITAQAKVIIVAPCCHKQIRKQLSPDNVLSQITKFGILKERQAEILTDTIRALILEAHGYKTNVFEFISTEHTPKNVIISAVKKSDVTTPDQKVLDKINELKSIFEIKEHYLETVLFG